MIYIIFRITSKQNLRPSIPVMYTTKKTLLKRLQTFDDISWEEFYGIYWPLVFAIGRKLGMTQDVCRDLMQEIMFELFKGEALLRYDPSRGKFRTFFGLLVRHKAMAMLQESARFSACSKATDTGQENDRAIAASLLSPGNQDENDPFQKIFDEEYRNTLLSIALNELRNNVEPKTYAIFEMVVLQERPAGDVALYLGINRATIDVYCSRCRKALRRIVSEIRTENPEFTLDIPL